MQQADTKNIRMYAHTHTHMHKLTTALSHPTLHHIQVKLSN